MTVAVCAFHIGGHQGAAGRLSVGEILDFVMCPGCLSGHACVNTDSLDDIRRVRLVENFICCSMNRRVFVQISVLIQKQQIALLNHFVQIRRQDRIVHDCLRVMFVQEVADGVYVRPGRLFQHAQIGIFECFEHLSASGQVQFAGLVLFAAQDIANIVA